MKNLFYIFAYIVFIIFSMPVHPSETDGDDYNWLVKPQFEKAGNYSEGFAAVMMNGKYGYINIKGDISIKLQFDEAEDFIDEKASVVKDGVSGVIDKKGKYIVSAGRNSKILSENDLYVMKTDGKFGYVKRDGSVALKPVYDDALPFSEGLAAVSINRKYGYINYSGRLIIKPHFEYAFSFHEGLAAVKINGKFGYIKTNGLMVINASYESAGNFREGLARISLDGSYGYINTDGEIVIEPQFGDASDFYQGIAAVMLGGKWGYIQEKPVREVNKSEKKMGSISERGIKKQSDSKMEIGKRRSDVNMIKKRSGTEITKQLKKELKKREPDISNQSVKGLVFIGLVSEVNEGQVVIIDEENNGKIYMGAWCISAVKNDLVYIEADNPISTVAKCYVPESILKKIKPGMKVYKRIK